MSTYACGRRYSPPASWQPAAPRRKPIPIAPSPCWWRFRPAAPTTPSRASSRIRCRRRSANRSWSRTSAAPAARSPPPRRARAEPDGYTIMLHQDALAAAMTLYPNRTFDAVKDFVPIGLVNTAATTLCRTAGPAAEQFQGTAAVDENAGTEHQGRPSRRRLVRASRRRADHAGARREGHPSAVSRRRSGAGRSLGAAKWISASSRPWSPVLWSGPAR